MFDGVDSDANRLFVIHSAVGVCFLIAGTVWLVFLPQDECPCSSVNCCSVHGSCPLDSPCLCVALDTDSVNDACQPIQRKRSAGQEIGATTILLVGIVFSLSLAHLLAVSFVRLVARLVVGAMQVVYWFILGVFNMMWYGAKTLYTKVSTLWARMKTKQEDTKELAAVELHAPLEET